MLYLLRGCPPSTSWFHFWLQRVSLLNTNMASALLFWFPAQKLRTSSECLFAGCNFDALVLRNIRTRNKVSYAVLLLRPESICLHLTYSVWENNSYSFLLFLIILRFFNHPYSSAVDILPIENYHFLKHWYTYHTEPIIF